MDTIELVDPATSDLAHAFAIFNSAEQPLREYWRAVDSARANADRGVVKTLSAARFAKPIFCNDHVMQEACS